MNDTNLQIPGSDDFFVQEAYKVLRTNLQFCGQSITTVAITSCGEDEGKTTITLGLGKSLAELNKRVLIIDADMRKAAIAGRYTDAKTQRGLSEILTGQETMPNAIYKTQYKNLHLLFAGKYPPNPVELLNENYFSNLLKSAKEDFDYVLIDTPPLGRVIDAAVIAPNCDGAIIVIGNRVRYHHVKNVVDQLSKSGSKILGAVRNDSKKKKSVHCRRRKYDNNWWVMRE